MSFGIYPVFNPSLTLPEQFYFEGTDLLSALTTFDELAICKEIAPLSSFTDTRDIPSDFDGNPDDLLEILGPWQEWFNIASGLKTCEFLLAAIPKKLDQLSFAYKELETFRNALNYASKHGVSLFRLEAG